MSCSIPLSQEFHSARLPLDRALRALSSETDPLTSAISASTESFRRVLTMAYRLPTLRIAQISVAMTAEESGALLLLYLSGEPVSSFFRNPVFMRNPKK